MQSPRSFHFTITNLTIKTGKEERTKKKNTLKEMTPKRTKKKNTLKEMTPKKKKINQGINPSKARIYKIKLQVPNLFTSKNHDYSLCTMCYRLVAWLGCRVVKHTDSGS